ncbi:alkylhydroperoxidase [Nonomuraea sp. WAC 01424]|uniref:carboxymuconolactone decarboxylase family protein n=1 Tax=Nonomuraea sp. WAC 01424 TaxID=2203200 RepID=UPI000F7B16D6|nr:carboxymuconolactone decarboxylase family protein [Nonomuraea sp. WAC 01424]RSN05692.1 alkylhydroperoxidase [Nonomuraea sp. WAC 01424]
MGRLLSRMTARRALGQVRYVRPVLPGAARGLVARVYEQVERDFGMLAPPVALHSPAPPVLAACWLVLRESLLASGAAGRVAGELVAMEVSAGNTCPYCVDVHGATLRALAPADPRLRPLAAWARASATPGAGGPPVAGEAGVELAAVAVTFQYLNRMVNVFLGDSPLPPELPGGARGPALRVFGALMRPAARRPAPPGGSLGLLPGAPLPDDLAWTGGVPRLGEAFARAAAAIEEGGARRLPDPVRELVAERVSGWDGVPPGPGRGWAGEAAAALPPAQRPAARLALLTALASHQVDRRVVGEFEAATPGEAALVEAASWAAMTAARRTGAWCAPAPLPTASTAD